MDIDESLGFWRRLAAIIDAAEARTFRLFGLDGDSVKRGNTAGILPLLLFAIAFAVLVLSYVIQSMLVKRPKVKPAALEDWDMPQSQDGTPQTVFFGDCWATGPMIVWYGRYRTVKIKSSGGGKK